MNPVAPSETPRENVPPEIDQKLNALVDRLRQANAIPSADALAQARSKEAVQTQLRTLSHMAEAGQLVNVATKADIADLQIAVEGKWNSSVTQGIDRTAQALQEMSPAMKSAATLGGAALLGVGAGTLFAGGVKGVEIALEKIIAALTWPFRKGWELLSSPFRSAKQKVVEKAKVVREKASALWSGTVSVLKTAAIALGGMAVYKYFFAGKDQGPNAPPTSA